MRCRRCGTNNPDRADFCYSCGAALEKRKKDNNGNQILLIILIIVIIIAIFSIGFAVKFINEKNMSNYNGSTPFQTESATQTASTDAPLEKVVPDPPAKKTESIPQLPATNPDPVYTEAPTPKPTIRPVDKKQMFMEKAQKIQEYTEENIDDYSPQQTLNTESAIIFDKWDNLLNEVYDYLKETLPKSEFEELKQDELEWIAEKEQAIKEEGEMWGSGTGRTYACNSVGIGYTKERCYYLISLIE